ncbi:Transcriptional regulator, TetR family OS=Tsukamurella paurometabola (strain ATCC 8368 / DSM/ CCUG 35730 / CIP 100753 / JCM 10117 / KCTC 9821 / NBRC 16120/ NCIMB 702349 / NCTC 13040) OX=521096 GN=Tpau_2832 PE=4 SV=1 [Tsukamurella paurometabola]|uniref:Transcriptional regulator, TetR family n=1 Tax=Tsukamurella paurometabola (strain ATCC 8368 / DSM 20162 / CCUG 35730 / CIP 100753 / JCM 10117 / KCTC 9821 / NBRC 16120 / NCIMB 702349 / NCTC 13040) TaxID=521096 RepID=D5UTE5_TSUPD|nr:TetR/AcrR family transcriptional regulator [Tsukamurella paurometabola]ADG79430.1 transcriptional regulator, TetR family [Tsukamurella paurometabola DSM 20162]SUP35699.1 Potential acrAB operon repressor [Tsukamurella paurometabola]
MSALRPPMRAPQQSRSRETRQRLLETTIASLADRGWGATTVGSVARQAGVSRGAAQHHFPTREDLISAALEYMGEQRIEHARQAGAAVPDGPERPFAVARLIVEYYTDDLFKAALHVWTAAASDDALRERMLPFENRHSREVFGLAMTLLGFDRDDEQGRRAVQATLDLARGLGLADLLSDDAERREQVVEFWGAQLANLAAAR